MCEVDLLGCRSLYFERFATDVVAAEELGRKVVHRRHGGLRVEFVRPLRELDIIGQLTAQMDLFHYVLAYHAVQADAVEQEDADVHRPVAEIRGGKTRSHIDLYFTVELGGDADRLRKDRLDINLRIGPQRIVCHGSLFESLAQKCREDALAVEAAVAVREDAAHFVAYGADENTAAVAPRGVFVENACGQCAFPRCSACQLAQVTRRNVHLLGRLSHGVVVKAEASFGHLHRQTVAVVEKEYLACTARFPVLGADRKDVVLQLRGFDDHALEGLLHRGCTVFYQVPYSVGYDPVQTLLVCYTC